MTIQQCIQDYYIGKMVKFVVREFKEEDGTITTDKKTTLFEKWITEWKYYEFDNKDWSHKGNYWIRDVDCVDKIISIKQVRNYWVFTTLKGYEIKVTATTRLEKI